MPVVSTVLSSQPVAACPDDEINFWIKSDPCPRNMVVSAVCTKHIYCDLKFLKTTTDLELLTCGLNKQLV